MAQRSIAVNTRSVLILLTGIAVLVMVVSPVVRGARDFDIVTDLPALLALVTMFSQLDKPTAAKEHDDDDTQQPTHPTV